MNKQPLLFCLLCFGSGIILQDYLSPSIFWTIGLLFLSIGLFGIGLVRQPFFDKIKSGFLLFLFLNIGSFSHFLNSKNENIPNFKENQNIIFQLRKKLNSNPNNKRYEIEILNLGPKTKAVLSIPKKERELDFLHFYSAKALIKKNEKPQHHYQFDYQQYLARQNIHLQTYITHYSFSKKKTLTFGDKIRQQRLEFIKKIDASSLQPNNKTLLKGIILADRSEINQETLNNFSKTGLIHILAISGTHMAVIFLLILSVFKPLFSVKNRNIPLFIAIIMIWLFALFIGFGNSVLRSCIMISTYYIMTFLQRTPSLPHAMALAGLIILGIDTQQIFSLGFQLSFLAVYGIYWLYPALINLFSKKQIAMSGFFIKVFSLSLAAQLAVTPLTIYYFHQFSIISVLFNTIYIPISQVFIIFSFIICILLGLNLQNNWILSVYDFYSTYFQKTIFIFAKQDWGFIENISINIIEVIILFLIIYSMRKILLHPHLKHAVHLLYLSLFFILFHSFNHFYYWKKQEVLSHKFFKQNSVSIKQRNKATFIISDKADSAKIYENIIKPYMISRRVDSLEIKKIPQKSKIKIKGKTYEIE